MVNPSIGGGWRAGFSSLLLSVKVNGEDSGAVSMNEGGQSLEMAVRLSPVEVEEMTEASDVREVKDSRAGLSKTSTDSLALTETSCL